MTMKSTLRANPLGFGTAPLGNMFRDIPEAQAEATVEAAWDAGIRYFDTAPFYGAGLAEIRLGRLLARRRRDEYVLSTKVGRIILNEVVEGAQEFGEKGTLFLHGHKNKVVYDYSADGTLRSIEGSLKRMGVDRIDFVWIHDIASDFHGSEWLAQFDVARTGAMRALSRLRDEGVIKGWGLGVNRIEPVELLLDLPDMVAEGTLLAGRYTLLDHGAAVQWLMPAAERNGLQIVVGGPYSSGVLVGGTTFEYAQAPPEILARVAAIRALAQRYTIPVKAAALQFPLAHPAVASVIPGASRPERIREDQEALMTQIPAGFWEDLRSEGLVHSDAPLPIDRCQKGD